MIAKTTSEHSAQPVTESATPRYKLCDDCHATEGRVLDMTDEDPAMWQLFCKPCAAKYLNSTQPGTPVHGSTDFKPVYGHPSQGEGYHDEAAANTKEKK